MATKTISIDLRAYEKLVQARRHSRESFSQVIHRATWPEQGKTCGAFLAALDEIPKMSEPALERLEAAQLEDSNLKDKWRND